MMEYFDSGAKGIKMHTASRILNLTILSLHQFTASAMKGGFPLRFIAVRLPESI